MRLFTKEIDKILFEQYKYGSDLSKQNVVAKIYNPYSRGTWYILNSDPEDPDYLWAIVDLFEVEVGSVSRSELESIKVPPFNLGLERDLYFDKINALELYEGLLAGKQYAHGGELENEDENLRMILNQAENIEHHADELEAAAKKADHIPAWVLTKTQRATTDLADVTHYLEGENEITEEEIDDFDLGGEVEDFSSPKYLESVKKDAKRLSKIYGKIYILQRQTGGRKGEYVLATEDDLIDEMNGVYQSSFVKLYGNGKEYADGGIMGNGSVTDPMATANEISRLSGVRTIAITEWADRNNINLNDILRDIKNKTIKGLDIMTAIAGNPNSKYQKELLGKYSRAKMAEGGSIPEGYHRMPDGSIMADSAHMADGGMMAEGGEVSKKINSLLIKLKSASQKGDEDKFDEISNKIHEISDNEGLTELEYNKWDEIRSKENEKRISKFSKMADGGMMAKGGKIKVGNRFGDWAITQYYPIVYEERGGTRDGIIKLVNQDTFDEILIKYDGYLRSPKWYARNKGVQVEGKSPKEVIEKLKLESFKKGGKVKFKDKVAAIKASLLERKKVSPKVQKDYGKTYSPKEAEESAKRIVGAMTAKERLLAKRKKGKK